MFNFFFFNQGVHTQTIKIYKKYHVVNSFLFREGGGVEGCTVQWKLCLETQELAKLYKI